MKKVFHLGIALAFLLALVPASAMAHTEGDPFVIDLIAGQHIHAGDVEVWNDGENLYVKFIATGDWCIMETHVHVATALEGIPQKNGNPIPGQFDYSAEYYPCTQNPDRYQIPLTWDPGDTVYIAVHAVVRDRVSIEGPVYASSVYEVIPGTNAQRAPSQALGEPNSYYEDLTFYSLGFGGCITLEFDDYVGGGLDVYEITWQHPYQNYLPFPQEKADVSVSADGVDWTYLGEATNDGQSSDNVPIQNEFELESCIKYVEICDTTDQSLHAPGTNAFDIDAIEAEYYCFVTETAWGDGSSQAKIGRRISHMKCRNQQLSLQVGIQAEVGITLLTAQIQHKRNLTWRQNMRI
jgi:hypothetical protein